MPINVDHYRVYQNLGASPNLSSMIAAASTSYNENMESYLNSMFIW
jgi:hypothetical protein